MKNYVFGYARVSTEAQNLDRQLAALEKYGVDMIYNEKMSGTKKNRPELTKLLDRITEGDTVVVESLSRLGRSTKELIELTETFQSKGVNLVSLKESIDTNSPTGKLLFTLMSAIAQFERDVIADRTREGLKSAKARGRSEELYIFQLFRPEYTWFLQNFRLLLWINQKLKRRGLFILEGVLIIPFKYSFTIFSSISILFIFSSSFLSK